MSQPEQRDEVVFEAALRLAADRRAAYLDQTCAGDPETRQRVEALLGAFERAGAFMKEPAVEVPAQTVRTPALPTEKPGDRIGRYKLLQQIGEGGCGVVYMAEQEEPVRRRVALKIIKLGMDTHSVIARFEAERQALALMDHPNIAKVFDAGATETGRPYFVMELVRGVKITEYCDEAKLPTRARLDLFVQVCQAIQHAHQKGIIHRDIKPSNILVTVNDGVAVPKVIDFGIAKATSGQQLTDKTLFTAFEQFIGTPAYMSPEQAVMTSLDIDTRSDIYGLGVLLYELLTGKTPFDAKELLAIGLDEMRRTIREQEPPRPSTRLSTLPGQELSTTAQRRGLDAPKLVSELRGDLDWIVMKALEKDRARRYETANGLASDIQRHLNNEPVVACPPSRLYRLQKTVRRNKLAFAASGAVLASLAVGLTFSTVSFFRERAARERADEQTAIAQAVNDFLQQDLLRLADSRSQAEAHFTPDPSSFTVRQALERAAERIGDRFIDRPLQEAAVRMTIGTALIGVGEAERAIAHLQRALELRRAKLGTDNPETLDAMNKLAVAYWEAGKRDQGLALLEETLKLRKAKLGPYHRDTLAAMDNLALTYRKAGNLDHALRLHEETLKLQKAKLGADDAGTLLSMKNLVVAYLDAGKRNQALPLLEEILKLQKARLGADDADTLLSMKNLANAYREAGKLDQALPLFEETLKLRKGKLGPDHRDTLDSMNNLAIAYYAAAKLDQALPLFEETLRLRKAKLGPDDPDTLETMVVLALAYHHADKHEQAEQLFNDALTAPIQNQAASAVLLRSRGRLRARWGQWKEAAADLSRVRDINPDDSEVWHQLAALLVASGQLDAYREHCRESIKRFGKSSAPNTAERIAKDCLILPDSGVDLDVVSKMADTAVAVTNHWAFGWFQLVKGLAEYRQGRFASAVEWTKNLTRGDAEAQVEAYMVLAMAHYRLKQTIEAKAAFAKGAEMERTQFLPKLETGDAGRGWLDWIIAHALMREAKALIEGASDARAETK